MKQHRRQHTLLCVVLLLLPLQYNLNRPVAHTTIDTTVHLVVSHISSRSLSISYTNEGKYNEYIYI